MRLRGVAAGHRALATPVRRTAMALSRGAWWLGTRPRPVKYAGQPRGSRAPRFPAPPIRL